MDNKTRKLAGAGSIDRPTSGAAPPPPDDPLVGQQIGERYTLLERIGGGGAGVIYRARHDLLSKQVALKLLRPELLDASARERFTREAQAAARLESPWIVNVTDHGLTDDGRAYLAMELLMGESLRARLNARPRRALALGEAAAVIDGILAGLEVAHAAGVVHRDLKPENVILAGDGDQDPAVKLVDFGLAKIIGPVSASSTDRLTATGVLLGTPHYMAPEQTSAELGAVGPWTDVYAVGVMLHELLAGARPFEAPSALALLALHRERPPPPLRSIQGPIPPAIASLVRRALAKSPTERFASAREMRLALRRALAAKRLGAPAGWAVALGGAVLAVALVLGALRWQGTEPMATTSGDQARSAGHVPDGSAPSSAPEPASQATRDLALVAGDAGATPAPSARATAPRPATVPPRRGRHRRRATDRSTRKPIPKRRRLGLEPNPYHAPRRD